MQTKSLEYFTGIIDATIEYILNNVLDISDQKNLKYEVINIENGFKVFFKWCIGYKPSLFQGNHHQPADDHEPVMCDEELYFSYSSKLNKIQKEIELQLLEIENVRFQELIEEDAFAEMADAIYEQNNGK